MTDAMDLSECLPLVEEAIRGLSGATGEWVSHDALLQRLLDTRRMTLLLETRSAAGGGQPTVPWLAANAIAWFGQRWTVGARVPRGLGRERHRGAWAYRIAVGVAPPLPGRGRSVRYERTAYSERIDEALRVAATAHEGQNRKGTQIPYVMHPVHVARILERHGWAEDVVIAGLLHDVIEDTDFDESAVQERLLAVFFTFAEQRRQVPDALFRSVFEHWLKARFGADVWHMVAHCTEMKSDAAGVERPWKDRKLEQLAEIEAGSPETLALKAADCLHNLHSMSRDVRERGVDSLGRFKAGAAGALWFNAQATARIVARLGEHEPITEELLRALWDFEALLQASGAVPSRSGIDPFGPTGDAASVVNSPMPLWCEGHKGRHIHGFGHWYYAAPPREGLKHWKDGRSAKELARAWTREGDPTVPAEVASAFVAHPELGDFRCATALPEHQTRLPGPGTEGRHHDLLVLGTAGGRRIVLAVEAKADEPFGPPVGEYLDQRAAENASKLRGADSSASPPRLSQVPKRVDALCHYVFGRPLDDTLSPLRYQLLHAVAGTLREAEQRGADVAVFLVHEFSGPSCDPGNTRRNSADLRAFVSGLGADPVAAAEGLAGPIPMSAGARPVVLFIGHVQSSVP
jgi:hypothetical protein